MLLHGERLAAPLQPPSAESSTTVLQNTNQRPFVCSLPGAAPLPNEASRLASSHLLFQPPSHALCCSAPFSQF